MELDVMLEPIHSKPLILIVDDETEIRRVLYDLLSDQYECKCAESAEAALNLLQDNHFSLIISDIMMSGMNGLEMVPHVLKASSDTVIIMISGAQTIESAVGALRAGVTDYIMKPFDLREVDAIVKRSLEYYNLKVSKRLYENHLKELVAQRTAELDQALASLENAYRSTLKALAAALETRDSETHGHSERVVSFSLRLGRELGLDKETMRSLEFGSLLHDIGKIGVPDAILRKPAGLTDEEWRKMRAHPILGKQILRGISFLEGAARVVAQHHEKWDGSGYPLGLRGEEIDINARIFAVADAFDAMISDRVYRSGRSYEAATAELDKHCGSQFDPKIIEAFHRVLPEEWEELRQLSLRKKNKKYEDVLSVAPLIESMLAVTRA
jgi:response regulator RpfG family c-di-GMP phosphodiesterase